MNNSHATLISSKLNLDRNNVSSVIDLLNDGGTVPFISRYRKDQTGGMEDFNVFEIQKQLMYLNDLEKRKKHILSVIQDQDKLSAELKSKIEGCWNENQLEDIYLPFKPKRKTKAEEARLNGLEILAKIIMKQDKQVIHTHVQRFVRGKIKSPDEAIEGAKNIISEWVSESVSARNRIRRLFRSKAELNTKVKKGKESAGVKYEQYFKYSEKAVKVPSHRFLAIQRGQAEGFLSVAIKVDKKEALEQIINIFIKGRGAASNVVSEAVSDAYSRLLKPSIENEILKGLKENADDVAIKVFAKNLYQLLMVPPLGLKRVLAIDPGFKSGCKIVCLDEHGELLNHDVVYPHPPQSKSSQASDTIVKLVKKYDIDAIAIGNGTAGRESENLVKSISFGKEVDVFVVNENGASIYSASEIGRAEFPNHDVTVRGAVSIGRRLIDPLSELVKIDPKSIGVGQYQHDVDQAKLKIELEHIVESCVNQVGVNVNTASEYLLQYVSGVGKVIAKNIIEYRTSNGSFSERQVLRNVPRLGNKVFEQCAGFMKIDGVNPLDLTSVHPNNYKDVQLLAKNMGKNINELINSDSIEFDQVDKQVIEGVGSLTLEDILKELSKPGFDPRKSIEKFDFSEELKSIEDIRPGMIVRGIVTNLTNFGAFVDIGIKENGLVHISQIVHKYISNPMEVLAINDQVQVKVVSVDKEKKRIALSIKDAN